MCNKQRNCVQLQNRVWITNFTVWKKTAMLGKSVYLIVVLRYGRSCQEMCGTILWVGKQDDSATLQSIYSMHWWPSFQRRGNKICWRIVKYHALKFVLKCLYLQRIGRLDILWSVNKLARSITKWTKACDKRLHRLISYIHHTSEYRQYCHVGNTAKHCRLGLFQDSDFAGDLEDSKSTSGGTLCIFGSHTFVPISLDVQETNFSFAQFDRIWNHLFGHWIEVGWVACSGNMGSKCFSFWKRVSDFR